MALFLDTRSHDAAWTAAGIATGLGLLAVYRGHRGRALARRREQELAKAVADTANRIHELEILRSVAQALLTFHAPDELFEEVARSARHLLRAEGGAVMLRSDEGDFLRVAAGDGLLVAGSGRLLPVEGSLAGWVASRNEPLRTEDMAGDPRNYHVEGLPPELRSAAVVPLRSGGETIGALAAYNRSDGTPFTEYDVTLLQALGDQVAVGLDRAAMLETARQNELALEQKNRELLEATELKSRFLANMSHELRTPLNAIIGFSDLILADGEPLDETRRDYLESIARNGRHLLGLINAVLDVSRLEAGRMPTRLGRFDLREVIRAAVADTESLRAPRRQTCTVDSEEEPIEVTADPQQIRQVLLNLLSNAAKFTADGGAIGVKVVRARLPLPVPADRAGDLPGVEVRDAVCVTVRDTGMGIREEDLDRLFQAFTQVDESARRQQQGTGLGLSLVKQLVELHGGTVGADSVFGEGSTFWFILPVDGPIRRKAATP